MNTSADVSKFTYHLLICLLFCTSNTCECWVLLNLGLEGVDGRLQFPLPSMNRFNQTEPATFSFLSCWATCGFPTLSIFLPCTGFLNFIKSHIKLALSPILFHVLLRIFLNYLYLVSQLSNYMLRDIVIKSMKIPVNICFGPLKIQVTYLIS